ncbi:SDR family NAD(P)-dependent oxidoreductase [Actinomadura sp. NPDC047616]|uniref:SDR family NAD(P)-dependent oxidoreductase n=1 Tax=Actinomadura sp. NPDC047616 TaxID=3155914 RepID=UPI0033E4D013
MSKVWFVTGSSRGLGRCFVEAALSRGDRVAATAPSTGSLDELVAAYGDAVLPLELDVTDKAAVFDSVRRAKEHFGRLDVIVNNAGYAQIGAIEEQTERELRDQFETNVFDPPLRVLFGQGFYERLQQVYADRLKTWADGQDLSIEAHGELAPR